MTDLVALTDGQRFSLEDYNFTTVQKTFLLKSGVIKADSHDLRLNYVGIFNLNETLYVCFPKTTSKFENKNELKKHAKLMIKSLFKFSIEYGLNDYKLQAIEARSEQSEKKALDKIRLYFHLIDDFRRYGLVRFIESNIKEGVSGKISWKKTISKYLPILNNKKQPVYTQFQVRKSLVHNNKLICDIHEYCVSSAYNILGWYYSNDERPLNGPKSIKPPCSHEEAIHLINKELEIEFEARKIRLYKTLINILSSDNDSSIGTMIGISNYWRVWEHMCSQILQDVYKTKYQSLIPQPKYYDSKNVMISIEGRIGQRFDIISEYKDHLFLIDAKYYEVSSNLPGWADLVKQFFYEKSLSLVTDKKIVNILCFPLDSNTKENPRKVEMISNAIEKVVLQEAFPTIFCDYIDVWEVISSYIGSLNENEFSVDKFFSEYLNQNMQSKL